MRISIVSVSAALALALLMGCHHHRTTAPAGQSVASAEPVSSKQLEKLRKYYLKKYPDSRVGAVIAARPQDQLAAVGDVPVQSLAVGQPVTFVDDRRKVLTTGKVVRVLTDSVH